MPIEDIQSNWSLPPWLVPKETPTQSLLQGAQVGTQMAQVQNQRMQIAQQGNLALQNIALNKQRMDMMQKSNDLQMQMGQNQLQDRMDMLQGSSDLADAMGNIDDYLDPEQTSDAYDVFRSHPTLWNSAAGKDFQNRIQLANQAQIWQQRGQTSLGVAGIKAQASTDNVRIRADAMRDWHAGDNATRLKVEELRTNAGVQKLVDNYNAQFATSLDETDRAAALEESKVIMGNTDLTPDQKLPLVKKLYDSFRDKMTARRNDMAPNSMTPNAPAIPSSSQPQASTPSIPTYESDDAALKAGVGINQTYMLPNGKKRRRTQ